MQVRAWLVRSHEELPADEVGDLAGRALRVVEEEFGGDGYEFAATVTPSPADVEIEIRFETTLPSHTVEARMPLINPDADLGFDRVEFGWEEF